MTVPPPYQTAHLADGVQLAYIDSWQGRQNLPTSYTTIVALHGVGFNSTVWTPLLAHLPATVRFLVYNQRGYEGSSEALVARKEGATDAGAAYLQDMLSFVDFAVEQLGVPVIGPDGKGGVALLGWSKGCLPLISLLALRLPATTTNFLSSLPPSILARHPTLTSHLRALILFDPPCLVLGAPPTPEMIAFLSAILPPNSPTPLEFGTALANWAASTSGDASQLGPHSFSDVARVVGPQVAEPECATGALAWSLAASMEEKMALARGAVKGAAWPVGIMHGTHTIANCLQGVGMMLMWWEEARREGRAEQPTRVRVVENATHFAHVFKPAEFAEAMIGLVDELKPVVQWF